MKVLSSALPIKTVGCFFCLKRLFAALTPQYFLPLYKIFIRLQLEFVIQSSSPILSRDAETEKIVKSLRCMKQLRLFSLTHRQTRGDLLFMFKITHGLLEFPMDSTFTHPTH